jgi:PAS domain S-box-containing protein
MRCWRRSTPGAAPDIDRTCRILRRAQARIGQAEIVGVKSGRNVLGITWRATVGIIHENAPLINAPTPRPTLPDWFSRHLIDALPIAVYICDAQSVLIEYNTRAAELWGRHPVLGDPKQRFCGAHRIYTAQGDFLPHDRTPMATVMREHTPTGPFEAIIEREDGTRRDVIASVAPLFDEAGLYVGFANCVQDVTDQKHAERRETNVREALRVARRSLRETDKTLSSLQRINTNLIESGQFLTGILDSVSDCIEVLDASGCILFMNREGQRAMEVDDFDTVRGRDWALEFCGDESAAATAAIAFAREGGVGRFETLAPTLKGNLLWWEVVVTRMADEQEVAGHFLAISRDITERKASEEARKLLSQELQHRLKNTLAMVQAIAIQSLKNATSLDEAKNALSKRIAILGRAHDILLHDSGSSADLVSIVGAMVDLHADRRERFIVEGTNVHFGPKAAMAMALALHELATNAQKYGALSNDDGHVEIRWSVTDDGRLDLSWTEEGGPAVAPPTAKGFGSRLTQAMLSGSIGGVPDVNYAPTGVTFTVSADLKVIQADLR